MKTNKQTMKEPVLICDDHHGVYMMQLTCQTLQERYKKQIIKQVGAETWQDVINGPECENHFNACNSVTGCTLKTETGQKFHIDYAEGGIWAFPACWMRTKKADEFFNC